MKWKGKVEKETRRRLFNLDGSAYIGVFATCTEAILLLPSHIPDELAGQIKKALKVEIIKTSIGGSSLVGCLSAGNSKGFIVSAYALDSEIRRIKESAQTKKLNIAVNRLPDRMSAVGNVILTNDRVALVHPRLSEKALEVIKDTLGVEVYKGSVAGLKTVGMAAVATNKAVLAHKNASIEELELLEHIFGLQVGLGSVNFGIPLIGAALLANTKGYAAGDETTGAELGRIEDVLGFM
jgi:translation initiation factor 6